MDPSDIPPRALPTLDIPQSNRTVLVRAIDTTARLICDAKAFVQPPIVEHESLSMRTMCFLLERQGLQGLERVLFDCGARKDYWNGSPQACRMIGGHVPSLEVESGVDEILVKRGVSLSQLKAVIWSHWHWDHIGDGSKFPSSVDIVVGPGFTEAFAPGFPDRPDSFVLKSDLEGHRLHEPSFELTIAGYPAHDYFGDGSFYLLDVPGHALGHMCGLARTTPDSFILLGGDCCHYPGVFRPTPYFPMPAKIPVDQTSGNGPLTPFSSSRFTQLHPLATSAATNSEWEREARTTPFYQISRQPGSAYTDGDQAQRSIDKLQPLDANANILVCLAHDNKLFELFPLFNDNPTSHISEWKKLNLRERSHWDFLHDLPYKGNTRPKPAVFGLLKDGVQVKWAGESGFQSINDAK